MNSCLIVISEYIYCKIEIQC